MPNTLRVFFHTFVLYALTLALGIFAAWRHVVTPGRGALPSLDMTLQDAFIFVGVFALFTLVMVRFVRVARASLNVFLVFALLAGTQFVAGPWLSWPYDLVAAVALVVLLRAVPRVLVHDVAIICGIAGVAGLLGLSLTPLVAAVLLAALSVYDIVSVYRTQHMVALAGRMLETGAVFGFLVPARVSGFLMPVQEAINQRSVMMLGSGDIGLPLVLATSAVSTSIGAALMVAGFALAGVMAMQWLFVHQERPMPMAALPPIAVSAILGYVAAILLGI